MRNAKRFLTLMLAVLFVVSAFAFSTSAATFEDVDASEAELTSAVELLSYLGVIKGTSETTFSPENLVTREQMAAFLYRFVKGGKSVEGGTNTSTFKDLEDPTFFYMVSWANSEGIIKGTSKTTFNPKGNITLQDCYTMVVRALGYEDEKPLSYPYGYIDAAEEIGLDADLDSEITYVTELTRADVAIILYNAFFAPLAEGEVSYEFDTDIGGGLTNGTMMTPVVTDILACTEFFGVEKTTSRVVATTNYSINDYSIADDKYGDVEAVLFADPNLGFRTFEELGLDGYSDEYFLSDFNIYLKTTEDTKTGEIKTTILFAEPLLQKTTVTSATFGRVAEKVTYGDDLSTRKLNGALTVGNYKTYMFDAPYTFAKPTIRATMDDADIYNAYNAKNVTFIGLADYNNVEGAFNFTTDNTLTNSIPALEVNEAGVYDYNAETVFETLYQAIYGGQYEMDVYDSNNDGFADYIWYKPYTFGQIDDDADQHTTYVDHANEYAYIANPNGAVDGIPYIYTGEAYVDGIEYENEDFVIAYVNGPANYVKVVAKVEPITAKITKRNSNSITLSTGAVPALKNTHKYIAGFYDGGEEKEFNEERNTFTSLNTNANLGTEHTFYIYANKLLYVDDVAGYVFDVEDSIMIPFGEDGYTKEGSAALNGYLVSAPYLPAYVPGVATKKVSIPVETVKSSEATDEEPATPLVDGYEAVYNFSAYAGNLCGYTKNSDGVYKLSLILDKLDLTELTGVEADGQYIVNSDTEAAQYNGSYLVKQTGKTYMLAEDAEGTTSAIDGVTYLTMTDYTRIILSYVDEDNEVQYKEYNASTIDSIASALTNVRFVIVNNPNSTRTEYLAVLYAEVVNDDFVPTTDEDYLNWRIVSNNTTVEPDEAGNYRNVYSVYNPISGKSEGGIYGTNYATRASSLGQSAKLGSVYYMVDGKLDDEDRNDTAWDFFGSNENDGVRVIENIDDGVLEIKNDSTLYFVDDDTIITVLDVTPRGDSSVGSMFEGSIATATLAELQAKATKLRSFAEVAVDGTDKVKTYYAKDIAAHIYTETDNKGNVEVKTIIIFRSKLADVAVLDAEADYAFAAGYVDAEGYLDINAIDGNLKQQLTR